MPNFIVRVALHGAGISDYEKLNLCMASQGFQRTILAANKVIYKLPSSEYRISGDYAGDEVLNAVHEIACGIGKEPEVLVAECSALYFIGLREV